MKTKKQQDKVDVSRRQFFTKKVATAAGVAGVGVVAASYAKTNGDKDRQQNNTTQQSGYQESEHVMTYYNVADF